MLAETYWTDLYMV